MWRCQYFSYLLLISWNFLTPQRVDYFKVIFFKLVRRDAATYFQRVDVGAERGAWTCGEM